MPDDASLAATGALVEAQSSYARAPTVQFGERGTVAPFTKVVLSMKELGIVNSEQVDICLHIAAGVGLVLAGYQIYRVFATISKSWEAIEASAAAVETEIAAVAQQWELIVMAGIAMVAVGAIFAGGYATGKYGFTGTINKARDKIRSLHIEEKAESMLTGTGRRRNAARLADNGY